MSEERDAAAVRLPPPVAYLVAVVLGLLLQRYGPALSLPLEPVARVVVAVVLGAVAVGMMASAWGLFKKSEQDPKPWKPTPAIVSTGIYRYTRNPMYVSMALVQLTVAVALLNGWIIALLPVVLVIIHFTAIRHEETYLERKFGETYLAYKRSVRRWL